MSDATKERKRLRVAILGSGNIGTDLLVKTRRSPWLECALFIGRNRASPGMTKALSLGVKVSDLSIEAIQREPECCDLVFDATSARDHARHWPILQRLGKAVIDLTPSSIGRMCVPAVNLSECLQYQNLNMVSCGGQASIPLASLIGKLHSDLEYLEVVSSIASRSAGPATRTNIDEYVETTERGLATFSGCRRTKVILILNPAQPCIDMQTTVLAKVREVKLDLLRVAVDEMVTAIHRYVPGYQIVVPPTLENDRVVIMVRVQGVGDYLPKYAGNLDIITCAAIATAEEYAKAIAHRTGAPPVEASWHAS